VAARRGLRPEQVIRFDANVPPLPGVPLIPLAESFARLNEYPEGGYGDLRAAAAEYTGARSDQIVVGAGADDLIALCARTFLGPGPVTAPSARIGAAALREPRLEDVADTVAERERMRAALDAAGFDVAAAANFVLLRVPDSEQLAERLEGDGLALRRFPFGLRA